MSQSNTAFLELIKMFNTTLLMHQDPLYSNRIYINREIEKQVNHFKEHMNVPDVEYIRSCRNIQQKAKVSIINTYRKLKWQKKC